MNTINRYSQFTWWVDASDGWTTIGDYDCNRLVRYMRTLNEHEVAMWCAGYEIGHGHGMGKGKLEKAFEIKRVLGL